jgi:phosphoglycolate phosphatase
MTQWRSIKAIAFDLDGTLIDSVPDLAAATNATLSELNLGEVTQDQVRLWIGNGAQVLMQRALNFVLNKIVSEQELADVMGCFLKHYELHLRSTAPCTLMCWKP